MPRLVSILSIGLLFAVLALSSAHSSSWPEDTDNGARMPASVSGTPVMMAVGRVGNQVVTSREVQMAVLVEKAILGSVVKDVIPVKSGSAEFTKALTQTMLEHVVAQEAENFSVAELGQDELIEKLRQLQDLLKGSLAWSRLEVSDRELEVFMSRKLRTSRFLKFKSESVGVQVSDSEALSYFEKNRVKFGPLPFENFKSGIKEYLAQEQLSEKLKDWFEVLKRKYRVQYLEAPSVSQKL